MFFEKKNIAFLFFLDVSIVSHQMRGDRHYQKSKKAMFFFLKNIAFSFVLLD